MVARYGAMHKIFLLAVLSAAPLFATASVAPRPAAPRSAAGAAPVEIHQRLAVGGEDASRIAALTLDACGGDFDRDLLAYLVKRRIPATVFVTSKWLERNPAGIAMLKANADLFQIEDHGANHVPAVVGAGRRVYGIPGQPDVLHLKSEVQNGAGAIERTFGVAPHWYRGATARYDPLALSTIAALGYRVAGFSVNADAGATLPLKAVVARLDTVKNGDVIIAHMNKPASASAEGLAVGLDRLTAQGFQFVKLGDRRMARLANG
jgi:peptidoglycan/xylan/chitin deacetylase (PgdA/CDA1 family)